jgi:hypothetical protein
MVGEVLTLSSELTRFHLRNQNCKQVLLGISHDAGYAPFLDETIRDERTRRTITVIEGVPAVRELRVFGLNTLNWTENLFRSEKLVDNGRDATPVLATLPPVQMPPVVALESIPARPPSATSSSYAGAGAAKPEPRGASPPPQLKLPLAPTRPPKRGATQPVPSKKKEQPPWNPGPRGTDPTIPIVPAILDAIKRRKDGDKLCNNHYLRGPCSKRDSCGFEHNYPATKEEMNAIAMLTRLNPCTSGQECHAADCIYGHHVWGHGPSHMFRVSPLTTHHTVSQC